MKVYEIDGINIENEIHEKVVEKLNNAGLRQSTKIHANNMHILYGIIYHIHV